MFGCVCGFCWCFFKFIICAIKNSNLSTDKPGKPIFKPARSVYTLGNNCSTTLGPIVCSSDCAPPCSYQWRAGRTLVNHAVFPLTLLTRPDGRNLTNLYCISKNRHGTFTRDITVRCESGFFCGFLVGFLLLLLLLLLLFFLFFLFFFVVVVDLGFCLCAGFFCVVCILE